MIRVMLALAHNLARVYGEEAAKFTEAITRLETWLGTEPRA